MHTIGAAQLAADHEAWPDTELVAAVRAGDETAFAELFRRYYPPVAGYVRGYVRDTGRAEDVTQEAFFSALRRLRETDSEINFRPWIHEIARNASIDLYRRSRRTREVSIDSDAGLPAADVGAPAEQRAARGRGDRPAAPRVPQGRARRALRHPPGGDRPPRARGPLLRRDRRPDEAEPVRRGEHPLPRPPPAGARVRRAGHRPALPHREAPRSPAWPRASTASATVASSTATAAAARPAACARASSAWPRSAAAASPPARPPFSRCRPSCGASSIRCHPTAPAPWRARAARRWWPSSPRSRPRRPRRWPCWPRWRWWAAAEPRSAARGRWRPRVAPQSPAGTPGHAAARLAPTPAPTRAGRSPRAGQVRARPPAPRSLRSARPAKRARARARSRTTASAMPGRPRRTAPPSAPAAPSAPPPPGPGSDAPAGVTAPQADAGLPRRRLRSPSGPARRAHRPLARRRARPRPAAEDVASLTGQPL